MMWLNLVILQTGRPGTRLLNCQHLALTVRWKFLIKKPEPPSAGSLWVPFHEVECGSDPSLLMLGHFQMQKQRGWVSSFHLLFLQAFSFKKLKEHFLADTCSYPDKPKCTAALPKTAISTLQLSWHSQPVLEGSLTCSVQVKVLFVQ